MTIVTSPSDVAHPLYADLSEDDLPRAPVLAVEVISPTSRLRDASLKKASTPGSAAPRSGWSPRGGGASRR